MLFGEAKLRIARTNGDQGSPNQVLRAGDAILDAIRLWDTKHDWAFRLSLGVSWSAAAGVSSLSIPGLKRVYEVRTMTPAERVVVFSPRRLINNKTVTLTEPGDISEYTVLPGLPDPTIYFWPIPANDTTGLLDYHTYIPQPSEDSDVLQLPEEYIVPLLEMAKYQFLKDRISDPTRIDRARQDSAFYLADAVRRDRKHPDHRERFTSVAESGRVLGRDPNVWDVN